MYISCTSTQIEQIDLDIKPVENQFTGKKLAFYIELEIIL